jgi:hypothetical protein
MSGVIWAVFSSVSFFKIASIYLIFSYFIFPSPLPSPPVLWFAEDWTKVLLTATAFG